MAAAAAMRCEHLLDGDIQSQSQRLLVNTAYCRIRMAIETARNLPAFVGVGNLLLPTNIAK